MTLILQAIWKGLYNTASGTDLSTLYHLRNLLQRGSVTRNVKSNPTVCEEFFLLVTDGHILCAVMDAFGMSSIGDTPSSEAFKNCASSSVEECNFTFIQNVKTVIDKHFNFSDSY